MDIITINKILYKEELRMIENLKKSIALLLSAMLMLMTSLDALFPVLSAIAVNDSVVETENNTENSDNEFYNSDSEVTETDNENNSVQEYNSDYAVYAESDIPEGDGQSNPYQINTLKQLYWFADEVNVNGNTSINAVLNTNLVVNNNVFNSDGSLKADTDLNKWTPIGNSSKKYTGTFDGQNHTISGLYFNDENISDVGLFGYISCGTIKNIGITNSYLKGDKRIGSVCGYNDGKESQIINCYNNASTVSGSEKTGGICGYNYIGTIKNSYNTGTVSSSSSISGGICGYNQDGKVLNSYNAGVISGNHSGGICGEAYDGSFLNCYSHSSYKDNIVGAEYYPVTNKNCDVKSSEQFESGEVAYLLGGIWGQEIGTDSMPVLNGEKVYKNVTYKGCGEKNQGEIVSLEYSNTEGNTYLNETHNFDNGICTGCGIYELIEPKENNGYYQIENANHLYWFANEVNNGNGSINAVLTADIVVNQNVLNEDGTLNSSSSLVEWTPIGNGKRYSGIFDGQNHTISGLYCNQNANYVGLIGYYKNSSGEIKNVGVIDSYFSGEQDVGGICGTNYGGKIINCYSISTVKGSEAGGICGNNDDSGTIENSYSIGKISGPINVGGICGHNSHDSTVANCYYNSSVYSGKAIGFNSATYNNVEGKTTEQFASGEVTFLLNDEVWGQKIGTDSRPVFNGEPVYQNIIYSGCSKEFPGDCTYSYSNTQADPIYPEHNYKNGVCTVCGTYESEPELKDDYYQIETIGHLLWFAEQVNKHGNININAVLTADIVLNQNLLNKDGTLNSSSDLSEWIPIGDESNKYAGIFDGQKHTISGLYFNEENTEYVGLFSYSSGTIKNVGVVDSYFKGKRYVGAVCGDNDGIITDCYNTGTVNGSSSFIGGICGWNKGTIKNSYNTGSISDLLDSSTNPNKIGGICGDNDNIITNCYNTGAVNGSAQIGGICGYNEKTVENSYNTGTINGSLRDIGGICGWNNKQDENLGSIINCYNTGTINGNGDVGGSGNGRVGGICGLNYGGTIENSYNTGAVNSYNTTESTTLSILGVGGICGNNNSGTIENSYSTGSVSGSNDYVGGVCGNNSENSTITNCYYNNSVYNGEAIASDSGTSDKVEGKTTEQFANGEVAYLLQEVQESEIWGQKIGTDSIPVLNGEKVYKNAIYSGCCEQNQGEKTYDYSNTKGDTYLKEIHKFENGICTACGAYEPAPLENGYYQISTANQLYWLAEAVNSGNTKINAVLTEDIVVNNNLLDSLTFDKYENVNNGSQFKQWTPIGNASNSYTGEFDGQNHTISGLYCNISPGSTGFTGNALFGYNAGTIKNIGVIDSYFGRNILVGAICGFNEESGKIINTYSTSTVRGYANVGGICGSNYKGTIENSYNAGIVKSYSDGLAGGICGNNGEGTITNCYNTGSVSGKKHIGGISGYNYLNNKIINCYNTGTVSGSENVGGVCGYTYKTKVENCYNTGTVSGSSSVGGVCGYSNTTEVKNCYYLENCNADGTTFTNSEGTAQTFEQFKNGEVAYSLQDKQDNQETVIWGQEIGKDELPVLNGKKVYENITYIGCCERNQNEIVTIDYSNTKGDKYLREFHKFENGICTACGDYEPAQLEGDYYQISNAGNLLWFAKQVNSGTTSINAVLTDNIVLNQNLLNADGTLNSNLTDLDLIEWTPIGTYSKQYRGIFDGQNHKISGLYYDNNSSESVGIGLFGWNCGTIKNVGIVDSYFNGSQFVGGVCGYNWLGTITNCYNASTVNGSSSGIGGICGNSNGGTITNCYNTSTVNGSLEVGGICGSNYAQITNCYNIGSVSGSEKTGGISGINGYMDGKTGSITNCYNTGIVNGSEKTGGICGTVDKGTVTDCYYLENCNADETTFSCKEGTLKTSEQFANGEVANLLQKEQETAVWGQKIGTDSLPVLNGENRVYKVTAYSSVGNEIISEIYTNNSVTLTAPVKEGYNFDGWYTYDESTEKLLCSSREYSFDATKDIGVIAVYKSLGTASITINCDREYTLNGVSKSSATTESYSIGSTVTLSCNDEDFAYWQNNAGTILSRESEYSFVVTNAETISAVFNEIVDNKVTLIFESFYGQVIATKQLGSDEIIDTDTISVPVRTGYNALGWDFDGDGKYDKNKDTLESAITRGFKSDARTVRIVQIYKLINENHKITVENGSGSGTYNQNDIVTAIPDEAKTGMKFSHWEDADNNILSYNEKYVFYVSEDLTIKAVYVAIENKIDAKGTTSIVTSNRIEIDKEKGKLSFVSMSTVPEGCKINKAGIIATNKSEVANSGEFTDKSAQFVRGMSSDKKAVRYTWTKGNIQTGDKWYVRAYLVYTDSDGNVHTVYSDVISQEY